MLFLLLAACPSPPEPVHPLCLHDDVVAGSPPLASISFAATCSEGEDFWLATCSELAFDLVLEDGSDIHLGAADVEVYLDPEDGGRITFGVRGIGDVGVLPDGLRPMITLSYGETAVADRGADVDFSVFPEGCGDCSGLVGLAELPGEPGAYRYLLGIGDTGRIEVSEGASHDTLTGTPTYTFSGEVGASWKEIDGFPSAVCDDVVSWRVPGE